TPQAIGWCPAPVAAERDARQGIPLGRGIRDVQLLVVGRDGRLAGIGELGEIRVRTPYLALGYLGEAELNRERFLADGDPAVRTYRTGDLGRYRPDGAVEFHG